MSSSWESVRAAAKDKGAGAPQLQILEWLFVHRQGCRWIDCVNSISEKRGRPVQVVQQDLIQLLNSKCVEVVERASEQCVTVAYQALGLAADVSEPEPDGPVRLLGAWSGEKALTETSRVMKSEDKLTIVARAVKPEAVPGLEARIQKGFQTDIVLLQNRESRGARKARVAEDAWRDALDRVPVGKQGRISIRRASTRRFGHLDGAFVRGSDVLLVVTGREDGIVFGKVLGANKDTSLHDLVQLSAEEVWRKSVPSRRLQFGRWAAHRSRVVLQYAVLIVTVVFVAVAASGKWFDVGLTFLAVPMAIILNPLVERYLARD